MSTIHAARQRTAEQVEHHRRRGTGHLRQREHLTFGERVADRVATTMGSWRFIILQSGILVVWIVLNVTQALFRAFDPYPFILMNLALSMQAAYAAPVIMMSQNRQAAKDRDQAELDLRTNLQAEAIIEQVHGNVEDLRLKQWAELLQIQEHQIALLRQVLAGAVPDPDHPTPPGHGGTPA